MARVEPVAYLGASMRCLTSRLRAGLWVISRETGLLGTDSNAETAAGRASATQASVPTVSGRFQPGGARRKSKSLSCGRGWQSATLFIVPGKLTVTRAGEQARSIACHATDGWLGGHRSRPITSCPVPVGGTHRSSWSRLAVGGVFGRLQRGLGRKDIILTVERSEPLL